MKRTKLGGLDVVVTGGTDREGGGDGPVVVLLHGFGAPGDDLVSLHRVLGAPPGTRFVFPAANLSLEAEGFGAGRAWWRIDLGAIQRGDARVLGAVPEGLDVARAAVTGLLLAVETAWKVPASRIVLGGFSQGSMLSLDVLLHRTTPLAGAILLSTSFIAESVWRPLLSGGALGALPIFQSHGNADPLLPFSVAETLRDTLKEAGAQVTWVPFRGGHEIPPAVLTGVSAFLQATLG